MEEVFAHDPAAVAVVESALIFEVVRDARARGEREACWPTGAAALTASSSSPRPTSIKIARYAARIGPPGRPARPPKPMPAQRLAHQIPDAEKPPCPTM
jgi:hypothetical protein